MQVAALVATIVLSFLLATGLTMAVRKYAIGSGLLDEVTERSSHTGVTPRGGGMSIVVVLMAICILIWMLDRNEFEKNAVEALFITICTVALIGWLDDKRLLGTGMKFLLLLLGTVIIVWLLGTVDIPEIAGFSLTLGILAPVVTGAWIFGLANSYNFMDGIDGLAAGQGAVAACTFGVWFAMFGSHNLALFCYALMAACLGFLIWNWSPARIFMGDIGSLTLGAVFAGLAVIGHELYDIPIGAAIILFSIFIADTMITMIRRLVAGKVVWTAHKEHYYQRAVQAGYRHHQVTITMIICALGLAVLATLEALRVEPRYVWYIAGLALLVFLQQFVIRSEQGKVAQ